MKNKEQNLIDQIQKINTDIKVYGRYIGDFEIWIVCNVKKDYTILKRAIRIINNYMKENNVNVNCVFIEINQIINELPKFEYTSNC